MRFITSVNDTDETFTELSEGLKLFPETTDLAPDIDWLNTALEDAVTARRALRTPLIKARVALRLANYEADRTIRACANAAEIADGSRRGPVFDALFPDGLTKVIAPQGARQIPPTEALISRMTKSKKPAVVEFAQEWQPKLSAPLAKLQAAADAYKAAQKADGEAFLEEVALREQHAHAVDKVMGLVRAAFPKDRAKQDLVFPEQGSSSSGESAESAPNGDKGAPSPDKAPAPIPA